jgi:hypothetical protein
MTPFLFVLLVAFAVAQDQTRPFEACKADREALCPDAANHHETHRCMHDNWSQLSEGCQTAIRQFIQEHQERVHAACGNDVDTFCSESKDNFDSLRQCMATNWESLSQECKDILSHHQHGQGGHGHEEPKDTEEHSGCPMKECANDVHTLCADADSSDAVHECLKTNWETLSEECRSAIEELIKANNAQQQQQQNGVGEESGSSVEGSEGSTEGMAYRESQTGGEDPTTVEVDPMPQVTDSNYRGESQQPWYFWFTRLWWTYPVGLVLIIQLLACVRIRQIRKQEAEL